MDINTQNTVSNTQTQTSNNESINQAEQRINEAQQRRSQFNQSILESSLQVSISSGNDSLSLVFRTAIEEINKVLEADLGANAIETGYQNGLDVSPEATADRIVSLTTAFFPAFQEQNPELSQSEAAERFTEVIRGGIDQGFAEAREILDGLNVLEGDIATNIDSTYELVQDKLNAFLDSFNPSESADAG